MFSRVLFSEQAYSAPSTQPEGKGAHISFGSDDELSDPPDSLDLSSPGAFSADLQEPRGYVPVAIEMATATRSYRVCIGKNTRHKIYLITTLPTLPDLSLDSLGKERKSYGCLFPDNMDKTLLFYRFY